MFLLFLGGSEDFLPPWLFVIGISVTIAISIAISVAIAIAIASIAIIIRPDDRAVQDEGHVLQLAALVELFNLWQHSTVQLAYTDNEDGQIGYTVGDSCIGHDTYWNVIDEDVVIFLAQLLNHGFQTLAHQQLCWVWSKRSGWNQIYIFIDTILADDFPLSHHLQTWLRMQLHSSSPRLKTGAKINANIL